ncbi:MAG: UMP kinase [Candidatus Thalassarchaeaceae archaeon]|jgi:uridylate kinase|nr:UMP kinase [Euryarchaeota archaeon]MDP6870650.1 UMP kinase [Candidatus Thalassarchaeaceae archaeon]|tara:strand:+ start:586 stop:1290 length:705 start_codon:yes stop_codon:yes gene_type:complete
MATVIAAVGGSLLRPEIDERHAWLEGLVSVIRDRVSMNDRIGLVVGGGAPAREGIELARPLIDNESHLDKIGIAATRMNATILREALSDAGVSVSGTIPTRVDEAVLLLEERPVVVMGGTTPGHTTDAVAIRFAIASGAEKCIIATNVSKVFGEDPRSNPDAEPHDNLTHAQLQEIVGPAEHSRAGPSQVVDPVGVSEAKEAGLVLNILDGRDVGLIRAAIVGEEFEGTLVKGD